MLNLVATRPAVLAACLALGSALAAPAQSHSTYIVKESHPVPSRWSNVGPAPASHVINLSIGLKQSQFEELESHLDEISDPFHDRYGQHLTKEEVDEFIKPTNEALQLVHEWLQENGIGSENLAYSPAKDWINIALPVETVERLLDTKYSVYEHESGGYLVRTPDWSLPARLHPHIQTIQPTNSFFRAEALKKNIQPVGNGGHPDRFPLLEYESKAGQSVAEVCNTTKVTPDCLRTLYGTIDYTPKVPGLNKVGLTDYGSEANNRSDVQIFLQHYRPDAVSAAHDFEVVVIAGGDNQQTPDTPDQLDAGKDLEGNLDAETILAIDYPTPLIAYTTGGKPPFIPDATSPGDTNEPYLVWLQYVLSQSDLPQVISTSYGDDEQSVPFSYAQSVCQGFAQLGARGVSVLFASGDAGVGTEGQCVSNDGKNSSTFLPSFPPTCPYVTAVGATKGFKPEVAAYDEDNEFSSGGGFSNYFPAPKYQQRTVNKYLKHLNSSYEYPGLYNKSGRAYPDIAAQGQRFAVVWDGDNVLLDGTSASTPTAAAVLSLVNDVLLSAGRKPLGFLNPWLYAVGYRGFTDITSGATLGCGVEGFPATKGWDAVTGFGTPPSSASSTSSTPAPPLTVLNGVLSLCLAYAVVCKSTAAGSHRVLGSLTLSRAAATGYAVAGVCSLAVLPYTWLVMRPTEEMLRANSRETAGLGAADRVAEVGLGAETAHTLLDWWGVLNLGRAALGVLGALVGTWVVVVQE
ncbi:MAG: hypothetical protein M1818_001411 [Claussenomyces sp. TS43310]|nr:MAG: hypothetical protein M1818_001411 [Claussenomyces sp. TS43310]